MPSLTEIAARGDLQAHGRGAWSPCPCCGADRRGRTDRRGPLSFKGEVWRCHASGCSAGGGPGALLAAIRLGEIPAKGDPRWAPVLRELEGGVPGSPSPRRASPLPRPPTAPRYPPPGEIAAVWALCGRLEALPGRHPVVGWLEEARRLDVATLGALDLARALPEAGDRPDWMPRAVPDAYRLVVPVYDARGTLRSLRFRAVRDVGTAPKALPPRGFELAGLVLADPLGLALLRGEREDEGVRWDGRVVVAEGEPDFLSFAGDPKRAAQAVATRQTHAVFGVVSGSWTPAIADRIPSGATVAVWTHLDTKGDQYAEVIRASIAGRCDVRRPRLPPPSPPAARVHP